MYSFQTFQFMAFATNEKFYLRMKTVPINNLVRFCFLHIYMDACVNNYSTYFI